MTEWLYYRSKGQGYKERRQLINAGFECGVFSFDVPNLIYVATKDDKRLWASFKDKSIGELKYIYKNITEVVLDKLINIGEL